MMKIGEKVCSETWTEMRPIQYGHRMIRTRCRRSIWGLGSRDQFFKMPRFNWSGGGAFSRADRGHMGPGGVIKGGGGVGALQHRPAQHTT